MKFLKIYVLLSFCIVCGSTFSQSRRFYDNNDYKRQRHELNFGLGVSSCQTDVGGSQYSEQQLSEKFGGTIFRSIYDTDLNSSNFVLNAAYAYHYKNRINFRGNLIFSRLSGNDKESTEKYRNNRSINFRTDVLELSSVVEFYLKKPTTGNKFNLKNVKGQKLAPNILATLGIYLSAGVGGFLYVPRARNNFNYPDVYYNDGFIPHADKTTYHKLRPLHTEGQGYANRSEGDDFNVQSDEFDPGKTYSPVAVCIPLGIGIQKAFNQNMGIKAELGIRYTFTDYIDDVSGLYYDKNLLKQYNGNLAATMSGTGSGDAENKDGIPGTYRYVGYATTYDADGNPNYPDVPIYDQDDPNLQDGYLTIDNNELYGGTNPWYMDKIYTEAGFKRGNPENKDYYAFLNVSFYKKFSSHGKVYKSIHSKERRRIKASF